MGKSKKRSLNLGIHNQIPKMSRTSAVEAVVNALGQENRQAAIELITLFGLSGEELLEAGACWEDVMLVGGVLND